MLKLLTTDTPIVPSSARAAIERIDAAMGLTGDTLNNLTDEEGIAFDALVEAMERLADARARLAELAFMNGELQWSDAVVPNPKPSPKPA